MGNNNTGGNEVEFKGILYGAVPVHLFFVLGRVCTVIWVVDKVKPGVSISEKFSRTGWGETNIGKASGGINRE